MNLPISAALPLKAKENPAPSQALVLSGGASFGAYQAGALRALLQGLSPATGCVPADPEFLLGTSTGSFNIALLLSSAANNLASAVDYVEKTWINDIGGGSSLSGNGVMRFRAAPGRFLSSGPGPLETMTQLGEDTAFLARDWMRRGFHFLKSSNNVEHRLLETIDLGSLISVEPLIEVIKSRIFPTRIRTSGRKVRIPATNWRTGELRIFTEEDMTPEIGHSVIQASTALPGIFPPVSIEGEPYADGGVHMNMPFAPAISAGADVIHVIYMDPDASAMVLPRVTSTISSIYRTAVIQWASVMQREIQAVSDINRGIELLEAGVLDRGVDHIMRTDLIALLSVIGREDHKEELKCRKITVHRHFPRDDSGETFRWFNFSRDHVARMISMGFENTIQHDCVKNKCVIPQPEPASRRKDLAEVQSISGRIAA